MTFHSIYRSPSLFSVLPRAAFVAIGLYYTVASLNGEWLYRRGMVNVVSYGAIADLQQAARWFPLDHNIRMGAATRMWSERFQGSLPLAIQVTQDAITENPYAIDLRAMLVGLYWENDQKDAAVQQMQIFKLIAPKAQLTVIDSRKQPP